MTDPDDMSRDDVHTYVGVCALYMYHHTNWESTNQVNTYRILRSFGVEAYGRRQFGRDGERRRRTKTAYFHHYYYFGATRLLQRTSCPIPVLIHHQYQDIIINNINNDDDDDDGRDGGKQ